MISAVGKEQQHILIELAGLTADHRCTILDCRMTVLGEESAAYMLITGSWDAVSKLEIAFQQLARKASLSVQILRTPGRPNRPGMPYSVNVVAADGPGIIHDVVLFFGSRKISVDDLQAGTYHAAQSDTRIFTMNMIVRLPPATHLPSLREEFMLFCDERNLDAVIEPMRG
ncbi:MAG: glycine cleavage system protein R, partial [Gammaproteobacteria bacterium]|nr:glycine cleavage system protein R [Gammaproteobacteria bacterium]